MEELRNVFDAINGELKCSICNKCLSVPPILFNDVLGNICGRFECNCLAHSRGKNSEQVAYETVAKFLQFPCMYKENGCQTELKWDDVMQHEESCCFKNFHCPLGSNNFYTQHEGECDWVGDNSEFHFHMEEKHTDRIFFDCLELNYQEDYANQLFFTKIFGDIIVVLLYVNVDKTALVCQVWAGSSIFKDLKYQVKIFDKSKTNSTALKKQNVELLCCDFLKKHCTKNLLTVDFKCIRNFIEDPHLIVVEFEHNNVKLYTSREARVLANTSQERFVNMDLKDAKCDQCGKELCPPVFMCLFSHNICVSCKKAEYCPKCSSQFAKSRNIAYEKLKFLLDQPCKNYSKGCLVSNPYPYIKDHEESCPLNPQKCILCSQVVDNVLHHLKFEHPLSISDLGVLYYLNRLKLHVFLFDNRIFFFTKVLITDEGFSFQVQCSGMKEVRYKYELHLVNDRFLGSEIVLKHICHPELVDLKKHETDIIKGLTNQISIPRSILEQLFPDLRNMKFKICISKIETSKVG